MMGPRFLEPLVGKFWAVVRQNSIRLRKEPVVFVPLAFWYNLLPCFNICRCVGEYSFASFVPVEIFSSKISPCVNNLSF